MRWPDLNLRALLVMLVASVLAGQPWLRATAVLAPFATDPLTADLHRAMCASQTATRLSADAPPPAQHPEAPTCPWCALGSGSGAQLSAIAAQPLYVLTPPRQLNAALAALAPSPVPPLQAWAAPPPRAPPVPLRALAGPVQERC